MTSKLYLFEKSGILMYAALKLAFVALFSLSLIEASSASPEPESEIACKGRDLIAGYEKSDPALLVSLRKKAGETVFGNSRLWKISKGGVADSWLFGTMHISSKNVVTLPASAQTAFENSETVLVELTEVVDKKKMAASVQRIKHLLYRLDGKTIEEDLNAEQMAKVRTAIKARAMPYELAIRMQPWMLGPAISAQLCEVAAKKQGKQFLDAVLMQMALKQGKQLIGLETMEEQLNILASLPRKFHVASLIETLAMGDRLDDIKTTMESLYLKGEIAMIVPLIRHISKKFANSEEYAGFLTKMLDQRNLNMAERAGKYMAKGNVFMAVGALHLPGQMGVAALLEAQGYTLSAADMITATE